MIINLRTTVVRQYHYAAFPFRSFAQHRMKIFSIDGDSSWEKWISGDFSLAIIFADVTQIKKTSFYMQMKMMVIFLDGKEKSIA